MREMVLAGLTGALMLTGPAGDVPLTISAEVGGKRYQATGSGECVTEPNGTIYDVPTEQWAARFSGEGPLQRFNLTLWKLKDRSAPQVTLWLQVGRTTHKISTVTGGGQQAGRATAELHRSGAGGSLVVNGTDAEGVTIRITAECARFEENTEDNG